MGNVLSVNISSKTGVIKEAIPKGYFKIDHGLVGDAHAGKWHRQVSLLASESIDKMKAIGLTSLCFGKFAENITTEGIEIHKIPVGKKIKIGEVVLEITQIGKECHNDCEIKQTIGKCIMPTEGVFGKVIEEGWISPEDTIELL